jgi:hypothetical protein
MIEADTQSGGTISLGGTKDAVRLFFEPLLNATAAHRDLVAPKFHLKKFAVFLAGVGWLVTLCGASLGITIALKQRVDRVTSEATGLSKANSTLRNTESDSRLELERTRQRADLYRQELLKAQTELRSRRTLASSSTSHSGTITGMGGGAAPHPGITLLPSVTISLVKANGPKGSFVIVNDTGAPLTISLTEPNFYEQNIAAERIVFELSPGMYTSKVTAICGSKGEPFQISVGAEFTLTLMCQNL